MQIICLLLNNKHVKRGVRKIMNKYVLYFGSKSKSRKMLLEESLIPFVIVDQDADESQCDWNLPLPQLVSSIAEHKMNHVVLPDGVIERDICFVLTADTMSVDTKGIIRGKPTDMNDAIIKIKSAESGAFLCTAFCLDKRVWRNGEWSIQDRIQEVVSAEFTFIIPDYALDLYIKNTPILSVSGGIAVEGFGNQFLKCVNGSYSTIIGLPLYEVRCALEKIGFFS